MDRLDNLDISQLAGLQFHCDCGKEHEVDIQKILIGRHIEEELKEIVQYYWEGTILVVSDQNTYSVKGSALSSYLMDQGFHIKNLTFQSVHALVPDEFAIGRLLMAMDKEVSLIIAVGSGTLNDLCRFVSYKLIIPYLIVATAPSMDGYASTVSPLITEGFKTTYEATGPLAILGDLNCMINAPADMIKAGFGDIMGKYTALADWSLSKQQNSEYYCEETVNLMKKAVSRCAEHADDIACRDETGIGYLMEALILSGVAMGLVGNSRPASGAEHHLAHFWEMDALKKGMPHALHGNMVGVGTLVVSLLYSMVDQLQKLDITLPDAKAIRELLLKVGCPTSPQELGISREIFHDSILHAKEIRPRYTILHLTEKLKLLPEAAIYLTDAFYR